MKGDPLCFFEHGRVSVVGHDAPGRKAILHVSLPCCLMQAVTPVLLGSGAIDNYCVLNPIAVWIPTLTDDRFKPNFAGDGNRVSQRANRDLVRKANEVLQVFSTISPTLSDPTDIIPVLPLGTYVQFRYRCDVDRTVAMLADMGGIPVAGIPELQYAMAAAMAAVLSEFGPPSAG